MNVLEVRGVSKRYGGSPTYAVQDVSFSVERGGILAVVGESGCGKTTLLRLIAGLEVPTDGVVLLNGHVASSRDGCIPPERRGVGIVFQDYALFPHLNVHENVAFGLQSMPRARRRERVGEALALVGLGEFARRFPHELSGGQQQRVALARALAPGPSLLLLDEPFSNLDLVLKQQVREEVSAILRAAQTTAVFVVHDLDDVLSAADRIAILKAGRLQQVDTPQRVYQQPADEYVARLFGATNLIEGTPRSDAGGRTGFETAIGFIASAAAGRHDSRVVLSLRPQDLEIADGGENGTASVAARVRQVRFRGDHQEVIVSVELGAGGDQQLMLFARPDRKVEAGDLLRIRPVGGSVRVLGG